MMTPPPALASNPRLLVRILEQVAAGNRRVRGLAEALDVEARVVQAHLAAGCWLGFLDLEDDPGLTSQGLAWVYGGRDRSRVWAEAVRAHPFTRRVSPEGSAPTVDAILRALRADEPGASVEEGRRRAIAIRRLLAPAWRERRRLAPRQLALTFGKPSRTRPRLDTRAGTDDSPDVYLVLLRGLLDHGEISPQHLRGLLDAAGGESCGLGGPMAMAVRRGDATRHGDALVVTAGAVARAGLAESAVSIALSDPDFRLHLLALLEGKAGAPRFRAWGPRFFGSTPPAQALPALLFGRSLATFPVAGDTGPALPVEPSPFLSVATRKGLAVAFPSSLLALAGGVSAVNVALRAAVGASAALPPTCVERRRLVHGGILHPGEVPPRTVADMVALRARVLCNAPAFALLAAMGVLDRRGRLRLRVAGDDVRVEPVPPAGSTAPVRPFALDVLIEALAGARGWTLVRGPSTARWGALAEVGVALGVLARPAQDVLTLDEAFFRRLQVDAEHRDLWEGLAPLADLLEGRLARITGG